MNRRAFLRLIGGAGLGATVDRKYFFAPAAGWEPRAMQYGWMSSGENLMNGVTPIGIAPLTPMEHAEYVKFICAVFRVPPRLILPRATLEEFGL